MSSKHQYLTNEEFSEAYDNKFELALYIIKIAQTKMSVGDDISLSRLLSDLRKEAHQKIEDRKAASK